MPGDVAAPPETLGAGRLDGEVEQLGAGDVGMVVEVVAPGLPHPWERIAEGVFVRVVAEHVGAAEVGFPFLEDRTEVEENDVVGGDGPIRWMLFERLQGVLAGADDPPMPVSGDSEHRCGQGVDLVGQLLLTDAAADHFASLDLVEQLRRLRLGVEKPFHPQVFVEDRLLHSNDATA